METGTREEKVAPEIAKYMVETLQIESVSDWGAFFKADEYEDGVQQDILDRIPEFRQDRIQRGRLRTAWTLARSAMKRHEIRNTAAGDDDGEIEAPLREGVKESADKAFKAAYGGITSLRRHGRQTRSTIACSASSRRSRSQCIPWTKSEATRSSRQLPRVPRPRTRCRIGLTRTRPRTSR